MNIEGYKRLHEAMEILSQGTCSPYRDHLENMFNEIVRLEREASRSVNYVSRVSENGSYMNSYRSKGVSKLSRTLNRLVSDVRNPVDSPLYLSRFKRGQRSSDALLNAATYCYIEGVSSRDIGKIFDHFGIESMSSTQVSISNKNLEAKTK